MPATYDKIATTTLTGSTQYITFSSIPQTYTDIVLVFANMAGASANINFDIRVGNGSVDTANYSYTVLGGGGASAVSTRVANDPVLRLGYFAYEQASGGNFIANANFMNYSNTTTNKTIISRANNANLATETTVALWRSTSAINIIQIGNISGNTMAAGTTATLYGIKAA